MSKTVVIDAGHGGTDPGAVGGGLKEKDLNLKIARRVESTLKGNYVVDVRMTRTADKTMSLKQRTDFANKINADYFTSIHINAGGGTGYEDYIHSSLSASSRTAKLRSVVHDEVKKVLSKYGVRNRGKKKANFHVVRETKMSAMLSENLFIDTSADQKLLKNNSFLNDIADAHAHGIAKALRLKKKSTPKPSPAPKPAPSGSLYKVQIGAFSDKKNAEAQAARARKAGFDTYIVRE